MIRLAVGILAAITLVLLAMPGPSVEAHGGDQVFSGDVGPYRVQLYTRVLAGVADQDIAEGLELSVALRDAGTGRPVDRATVTVSARSRGNVIGPTTARRFTNLHDVYLPGSEPDLAETWNVEILIEGPLGDATLTQDLAPSQEPGGPSIGGILERSALLVLALFGTLALVYGTRAISLRRRRAFTERDQRQ